jgi:hypothetical protein
MAHFAELDENNIVKRVIVVNNNELLDANGNEVEQKGIDFCESLFGGVWKQTSYNNNFRKQYAGTDFFYDSIKDEFVLPQPFPSWTLSSTNDWVAPVSKPENNDLCWHWNEETLSWENHAG